MNDGGPGRLRCAVVVCTYSLDRLDDLDACLDSLERQDRRPDELIVVVDHNPELAERIRASVTTIPNAGERGLSHARNTAVAATTADVIAFIDDDAVAEPGWLDALVAPFADPRVAAVGGRIEPAWPDDRPDWFPRHLDWTVGCTNPGLPDDDVVEMRNVFGASAAFRRTALERVGGFPVELGRVGADVAGCEETHVCIRIRQTADETVVFAPGSLVHHRVTPARTRVSYVLRRCFGEGRSKARLGAMVGASRATADERDYSRAIVGAVSRDVAGALREPRRLKRAAVLGAGLSSAAAGYLTQRVAMGLRWQ